MIHYNLQTHLFIGEICNHVDLETVQPWMVARSPVSTLDTLQEIKYPIPATPAHHNLAVSSHGAAKCITVSSTEEEYLEEAFVEKQAAKGPVEHETCL